MFGENGFCDHGADTAWPTNAQDRGDAWTNRISRSRMPDLTAVKTPWISTQFRIRQGHADEAGSSRKWPSRRNDPRTVCQRMFGFDLSSFDCQPEGDATLRSGAVGWVAPGL